MPFAEMSILLSTQLVVSKVGTWKLGQGPAAELGFGGLVNAVEPSGIRMQVFAAPSWFRHAKAKGRQSR